MERTPRGTPVGVDDPYECAGICEYLTSEGRCRYAYDHGQHDPEFARERASEDYECLVIDPDAPTHLGDRSKLEDNEGTFGWRDCPHYRSRATSRNRECVRCGLEDRRIAAEQAEAARTAGDRPLLEEHHLSYASDGETLSHEITIYLCRWCHAKVHNSWARITDDVAPDPEAIAAAEARRSAELEEAAFETAAERTTDGNRPKSGVDHHPQSDASTEHTE